MLQGQSEAVSDQLNEEEQLLVISRLHQVSQHAESWCHGTPQATDGFHHRGCVSVVPNQQRLSVCSCCVPFNGCEVIGLMHSYVPKACSNIHPGTLGPCKWVSCCCQTCPTCLAPHGLGSNLLLDFDCLSWCWCCICGMSTAGRSQCLIAQ